MRKLRLGCGVGLFLFAWIASAGPTLAVTDLVQVDAILCNEHLTISHDESGHKQLSTAIAVLEKALDIPVGFQASHERDVEQLPLESSDADLAALLSQFHFILANAFLDDPHAIEEAYLSGKHWGLKSLRLDPQFANAEETGFIDAVAVSTNVGALYWTSLNWLRTVEMNHLAAVGSGVLSKTRAMLERALQLSPGYYGCGPARTLGSFWGGLPRKPFGTYRRNLARAAEYFAPLIGPETQSNPVAPCAAYLENRLNYVQFVLIQQQAWSDAAQELRALLSMPIGEAYPLENALALDRAAALLHQVEEHL